ARVQAGELAPEKIDEAVIARHLYLPDVPDPDLMIRTSGELRLSNFLLWELSYAEFYFTETLWPDFREPDFARALAEYARRRRRYGAPS
ncbi:MAG TPA: undecaprenyl diphosphate synthase family protein, partial [Kiritimatiellia bacterium]|nr:undecaprenyl diphosphate synthase family protein [Kiritimatiellia bacterium]